MKNLTKILSILLITAIPLNSYAGALHIVKDQPAPYSGVLLDDDTMKAIQKDLVDGDANKQLVESYKKSIDLYKANEDLYQKKVDLYSKQNDVLAANLQSERSVSNWGRLGFFLLGVAATCLAGYSISRIK